jgi:hypothetical protein
VHLLFASRTAVLSDKPLVVLELKQARDVRLDPKSDIAAWTPIAAVRSTFRHELLAPEGHRAIPTVTSFDIDARTIDKHGTSKTGIRMLDWDDKKMTAQ